MGIGARPVNSNILLASKIPFEHNRYVLGSFSGRVNFSAQQRRAFSLVMALDRKIKLSGDTLGLKKKSICIVGAGLAGITAAAAFSAYDAEVHCFEKQKTLFENMKKATHRDIHPSINFWPLEDISPSTYFPVLNWFMSSCPDVLNAVEKEWKEINQHCNGIHGVFHEVTVTGMTWNDDTQEWRVEFENSGESEIQRSNFDYVIFATGFGTEKKVQRSSISNYWVSDEDVIDALITETEDECITENYIVSGVGDGGIIEVLRLIFGGFKAGEIHVNTVPMLVDDNLSSLLKKHETSFRSKMSELLLKESAISIAELRTFSEGLTKSHGEALSKVSLSVRDRLIEVRTKIPEVILFGREKYPFNLKSSPYHRLLLSIAIKEGWVKYYQIEKVLKSNFSKSAVVLAKAKRKGIRPRDVKVKIISELVYDSKSANLQSKFHRSNREKVFKNSFYICRHGSESSLGAFISNKQIAYLRKVQQLYGDQDWISRSEADNLAQKLNVPKPSNRQAWASRHVYIAEKYFADNHGVNISVVANDVDESVSYAIVVTGESFNRKKAIATRNSIPKVFFGMPVSNDEAIAAIPIQSESGF